MPCVYGDYDDDGDDGDDNGRPTKEAVVGYRENALAFFCAVACPGARSVWGTLVDANIRVSIAALAAPYIICSEMFEARHMHDALARDQVFRYEHALRRHGWWWGLRADDCDSADLHTKSLACHGVVFGGITMPWQHTDPFTVWSRRCEQRSEVLQRDDNYDPTYITYVVQRRGSCFYNMDVMVRADGTLRQLLRAVFHRFRLGDSARLILWGIRGDGATDTETLTGGLSLHHSHTSPLLDLTMGSVWELLETQRQIMHDHWTLCAHGEHDPVSVHEEHRAIWTGVLCVVDKPHTP